jgi:extracellular factor (EF) 3-hydroxypalmitic acid methyl ester biosynthesis protein
MVSRGLQCLNPNDWVLIRAKTVPRMYKLGEEIIREGELIDRLFIIRRGEASVELAGTGTRAIVASLGPNDVCGEIAFLEQGRATAAVIASDQEVEVEEIHAQELRDLLEAFPRLAARFYLSVALVLSQRLRATSRELATEMRLRDRCETSP